MRGILGLIRGVVAVLAVFFFVAIAITTFLNSAPLQRSVANAQIAFTPAAHSHPFSLAPLSCMGPAAFTTAASHNQSTLTSATVHPFGVPEQGWAVYAPLISHEIGTACPADSPGFAAAFSSWQAGHRLAATGEIDQPALSLLATTWLLKRPFVRAMKTGCPGSPNEDALATASPTESFGGKTIKARPGALQAYRRMMAAARQDLSLPPQMLTIASAYRGPTEEAARCADGSCGNPAKARCSAHRTGLAFDFYLGATPGRQPFSTADEDRLMQADGPAYRWLVQHADQFGFVPYPYEPWHWEWTGESP